MVESAIIAMVMVICFACLWAAVSFEHAKIRVMDEARVGAWAGALAGGSSCSGGENLTGELGNTAAEAGSDALPDTSKIEGQYMKFGGNEAFTDSGYLTVQIQRNVTFPGIIGGTSYAMQGKFYIRCNEQKKNDDGEKYFLIALGIGVVGALIASLL